MQTARRGETSPSSAVGCPTLCSLLLEYKNIDKIELNYPGKIKLFPIGMFSNLGDWGYDELTSVANGLFRHEILFSSGATIIIDFRQVSVHRKRAK